MVVDFLFFGCVCLCRLKPKFYDFKVEVFSLEYNILNVDSDEYNYICVIKDVKRCVAWENEVVEMNPYEKFKVEAGLPLSRAWYLVEGDNDYGSIGKLEIRIYVEAQLVDSIEPRSLLEALPVDNKDYVRQDNEEDKEDILDEFYWSVESDEIDHEKDHESGHDGQRSGCKLLVGFTQRKTKSKSPNNNIEPKKPYS
ncbi:hypothetical protein Patl1_30086 [Pistacia atlantica]|uniref:Uncharacterized protein n=1 Tax=Pistacia atlantica TaxID=434234 RepID=A0ACC1AAB2_9ROSI|nr:hypothetical protein Patl1_30086 [Pistacia atlantica]